MIAFATADSFVVLLVASFVWGIAADAFAQGAEIALVDLYQDELPEALGRQNALGAVGDLLGPLTIAAAAALGTGWRPLFMMGGLAMLVYAAWLAAQRFPKPSPPDDGTTPLSAILGALRDGRLIMLALVGTLFGTLDEPLLGFTIAYLEKVRGLDPAHATFIITVGVGAGVAGYVSLPLLTRRMTLTRLLVFSGIALAVTVPALVLAPAAPAMLLAMVGFGLASAGFWTAFQATYLGLRPGLVGTSEAVASAVEPIGLGFPLVVGAVADAYGLTGGLSLYMAVPIAILLLLAFSRWYLPSPLAREGKGEGETRSRARND
jgi:FSR family fosmidomycin resistance protein-like MFS transporter